MKRLLIILGAGSSIPVGMPSVSDLDRKMFEWSDDWSPAPGLENYYRAVWKGVEQYYFASPDSIKPSPNFEKVLGEMVGLAHWMTPPPFGNALRQLISPTGAPIGMAFHEGRYAATVGINDQLTHQLVKLAQHMRELCKGGPVTRHCRFSEYEALFSGLRKRFELGVFNLNYDNAALTALPGAFAGFDSNGRFSAAEVHERTTWDFVYHLHGSVHHKLEQPFGNRIDWFAELNGTFFDGHVGNSTDTRSDNRAFPKTSLIAGGFKLDQLLAEPFLSFYAALIRRVYEADAILIGGYGFGDMHVNRALQNRLEAKESRPPVAVLTWSPGADPMEFRSDEWGRKLAVTLHAPTPYREPGHTSPPHIADLISRGGFEVCSPHRVAIWHAGFLEATRRLDAIADWLDGAAQDAVLAGTS
ncbi:SIR2 family protein [Bradyrhizobium sp.]|uniref:SIR2 family protein n=1 Tax=Bradyrhizobium sp. TaxID=376 RepID=UPI002DDD4B3A|nr:SIR2 family protein [Bradyrhizobium sp.]HEV2160447.1 SIR2 family protein [Bradyrhizobium sp.]